MISRADNFLPFFSGQFSNGINCLDAKVMRLTRAFTLTLGAVMRILITEPVTFVGFFVSVALARPLVAVSSDPSKITELLSRASPDAEVSIAVSVSTYLSRILPHGAMSKEETAVVKSHPCPTVPRNILTAKYCKLFSLLALTSQQGKKGERPMQRSSVLFVSCPAKVS